MPVSHMGGGDGNLATILFVARLIHLHKLQPDNNTVFRFFVVHFIIYSSQKKELEANDIRPRREFVANEEEEKKQQHILWIHHWLG